MEVLTMPVAWWWIPVGFAIGAVVAYIPTWYAEWRLQLLLWRMLREAKAQLAAMKAERGL